jgi:hypothetical protein
VTARGQKLDQEPNDQPHTMLDQERNDQPPMMTCDITYIQYINSEPMPSRIRRAICLGSHPKLSVTNLAAHITKQQQDHPSDHQNVGSPKFRSAQPSEHPHRIWSVMDPICAHRTAPHVNKCVLRVAESHQDFQVLRPAQRIAVIMISNDVGRLHLCDA